MSWYALVNIIDDVTFTQFFHAYQLIDAFLIPEKPVPENDLYVCNCSLIYIDTCLFPLKVLPDMTFVPLLCKGTVDNLFREISSQLIESCNVVDKIN